MSENSTTQSRYIKSYEIRRAYQGGVQYPPAVSGVQGAIDIHCHADAAHQDALSVAKLASKRTVCAAYFINPSPASNAPNR